MIKENPELLNQLKAWVKEHPEIENNSCAKLQSFYKKTPYFDSKLNVYPVLKIVSKNEFDSIIKLCRNSGNN